MKKRGNFLTGSIVLLLAVSLAAQEIPVVDLKLKETESAALENSHRLKAAQAGYLSAVKKAESEHSRLLPKILLEGNYRYYSTVSEVKIPIAGVGSIKLGDQNNYSIGPSLYWTIWDKYATGDSYASVNAFADSKKMERDIVERQVILAARSAFFQAGLAKEEVTLLSDALKLAQFQYADIKINVKAGTKSRMDEISAHQEVLIKMRELRQARADLASALNELSAITGTSYAENILLPMDASFETELPKDISVPTLYVSMEPEDTLIEGFSKFKDSKFWENHPDIEMYEKLALSAELLSKSASSGLWPKFSLSARSSIDYPNGPILETINQNMAGISLTWPIYEGNLSRAKAQENRFLSESQENLKEQKEVDLKKDWRRIQLELSNLEEQTAINEMSVSEAKELSGMVYKSYKIGSANFTEVENANFKFLEAQIQSAKTKFLILVNLATLASLSE